MLSVIIFIFWPDDEKLIETCLKTVSWADEIIVVDNGATKKTVAKCKKYTKKIFASSSKDFSARHNLGKDMAAGDWLLYVDSDERVSTDLREQIQKVLQNPQADAYRLRRVNIVLGKASRFGDRYPDFVTRLFRKEKLRSWKGEIHESSEVAGSVKSLDAPLYHLTHRDIYSMMTKTINFAEAEAKIRFQAGHPPVVWWRLIRVILTELWQREVVYQGWRGGTEGWIDGIFQAFSLFVVYVRLWEMQRQPPLEQTYQAVDQKILRGENI